ncbi:hypothetical protein PZA11_002523 [Diplocarpon coronariae]|uniref:Serine carboxypeptidase n=1 Tax=Diplocarpon coronariae TaxID=2795749 RepID=A0A218ZAK4_9HELO|nr:hypothetical protein JHW43_003756 [Diplocarpon mali]OWP05028.1 hypothetical protein B2J93_598 [Marssonina coronariae]
MLSLLARTALVLSLASSVLPVVQADRLGAVTKPRGYDSRVINQRPVEEAKQKPKRGDSDQGPLKKKKCNPDVLPCPEHAHFRFLTKATTPFLVNNLPDVKYDIGEMYSGLIPINKQDPDRSLFFVFQPTDGPRVDEVTIWLNGGPGCSSLIGFFQENGRFTWSPGMSEPAYNPYSWVGLTNVLWVDQPAGAGYSMGDPMAESDEDVAEEFADFFLNFQRTFGISNFKIYLAGSGYAGRYVPYISAEMLQRKNKKHFDVKGALMYDATIGSHDVIQREAVAYPYLEAWNNVLGLNSSFREQLKAVDKRCGHAEYREKYLRFPATEKQPATAALAEECAIFRVTSDAASKVNPCFNPYDIRLQCPLLNDPLGVPTRWLTTHDSYSGPTPYFDRDEVKAAMHAPATFWQACTEDVILGHPHDNPSSDSIQKVLPALIEATNRVLVSNSALNYMMITDGALLSIQNMTWGGKLGFQAKPETPIVITLPNLQYQQSFGASKKDASYGSEQGTMGVQHYERGLMWAETFSSGHQQSRSQPRSSFRHLQWVLGHIQEL